jgi:hypothetical protein
MAHRHLRLHWAPTRRPHQGSTALCRRSLHHGLNRKARKQDPGTTQLRNPEPHHLPLEDTRFEHTNSAGAPSSKTSTRPSSASSSMLPSISTATTGSSLAMRAIWAPMGGERNSPRDTTGRECAFATPKTHPCRPIGERISLIHCAVQSPDRHWPTVVPAQSKQSPPQSTGKPPRTGVKARDPYSSQQMHGQESAAQQTSGQDQPRSPLRSTQASPATSTTQPATVALPAPCESQSPSSAAKP